MASPSLSCLKVMGWAWLGGWVESVLLRAGEARIRVQMSAVHSPEEVERCAQAFIEIGKSKGVIP